MLNVLKYKLYMTLMDKVITYTVNWFDFRRGSNQSLGSWISSLQGIYSYYAIHTCSAQLIVTSMFYFVTAFDIEICPFVP
jgi:hypothetical protein